MAKDLRTENKEGMKPLKASRTPRPKRSSNKIGLSNLSIKEILSIYDEGDWVDIA